MKSEIPSLLAAVRKVPLERLLTETDATGSGQYADPADVLSVVEKVASLRGTTMKEIGSTTTANLKSLLKL